MSVYCNIVQYDGTLFKQFTQVSRGFRKHLLFYIFTEFLSPIAEGFTRAYGKEGYQVIHRSLTWEPISFCNEVGARLDATLKI